MNTGWLNGVTDTPRRVLASAWIDVKVAADLLCVTPKEFVELRRKLQTEGTWSIEWRPNSTRNDVQDARGCGLLLLKADVERVANIRKRCRCSVRQAIRYYNAVAIYGAL